MTKVVRIENIDGEPYKLIVQVWAKYTGRPDELLEEYLLSRPAQQQELTVHANRYLVIKEGY